MHSPHNTQAALGGCAPSAATERIPFVASRPPYQQASYRILDQDHSDITINNMTTGQYHASLPCPQLPVSTSPTRAWQSSSTLVVERPNSVWSSSSSGSIRRSVSGMKNLMPLKLQSPRHRPKTDMSSWLRSTSSPPHSSSPVVLETESEATQEAIENNKVPWMWSQGGKMLHDLSPNKYRETPIYSEPRSPMLCRAYFNEEDLCYNCPPPGSFCDELCIVSDYEEEDSTDSQSRASFPDLAEPFDPDMKDSHTTSPTSSLTSRFSGLSIMCQGELSPILENRSLSISPTSQYGSMSEETEATTAVEESQEAYFNQWLDADSSRASSPDSLDSGVFSACATPLAPARATMIVVPKSPIVPSFAFQEGIYSPPRPSTPFKVRNRQKSSMDENLSITAVMDTFDNQTARPRGRSRKQRPPLPRLKLDLTMHTPPPTPYEPVKERSRSPSILIQPLLPPTPPNETEEPSTTDGVIDAICDILSSFPHTMLFLDTPCIRSIRRLNTTQNGTRPLQSSSFSTRSIGDPPMMFSPPDLRPRRYQLRRSKSAKFFATRSIRRKSQNTSTELPYSDTTTSPINQSSTSPSAVDLSSPNLRPLRAIFPHTDDWWRNVLYAHLVAYNYVCTPITSSHISDINSHSSTEVSGFTILTEHPNQFTRSLKASRTLGLGLPTIPYLSGREARLEEARSALEGCVARVAECMMTEGGRQEGAVCRVDEGFVRALAEVVRASEGLS